MPFGLNFPLTNTSSIVKSFVFCGGEDFDSWPRPQAIMTARVIRRRQALVDGIRKKLFIGWSFLENVNSFFRIPSTRACRLLITLAAGPCGRNSEKTIHRVVLSGERGFGKSKTEWFGLEGHVRHQARHGVAVHLGIPVRGS